MALGAVLLEVFLANMPPPEESQLNSNQASKKQKKHGTLVGFNGFLFPIFWILFFFLAFLRFYWVFDGGAANF